MSSMRISMSFQCKTVIDSPGSKPMSLKVAADTSNTLHDKRWRYTKSRWKENELTSTAKPLRHILMFRIIEEARHKHQQKILLSILTNLLQRGKSKKEVTGNHIFRSKDTHQIKTSLIFKENQKISWAYSATNDTLREIYCN